MNYNTLVLATYLIYSFVLLILIPGYVDQKISRIVKKLAAEFISQLKKVPGKKLTLNKSGGIILKYLTQQNREEQVKNSNHEFNEEWFTQDLQNTLNKVHFVVFGSWYIFLVVLAATLYLMNTTASISTASQVVK